MMWCWPNRFGTLRLSTEKARPKRLGVLYRVGHLTNGRKRRGANMPASCFKLVVMRLTHTPPINYCPSSIGKSSHWNELPCCSKEPPLK